MKRLLRVRQMSNVHDFLNMSDEDAAQAVVAIREKAAAEKTGGGFDNATFPVHKINVGSSCVFRFLPDANKATMPNFWVVKKLIPLQFVDPENDEHFVKLNVPVREMYDPTPKSCPVINLVRPLYKEAEALMKAGKSDAAKKLKTLANKHWIQPEYVAQGFAVKAGFEEQNIPTNPIRFLNMKKTVFKLVFAGMNP